jgi:hypothetical protein
VFWPESVILRMVDEQTADSKLGEWNFAELIETPPDSEKGVLGGWPVNE